MIKLKAIKSGKSFKEGDEIEAPEEYAYTLVKNGICEIISGSSTKKGYGANKIMEK